MIDMSTVESILAGKQQNQIRIFRIISKLPHNTLKAHFLCLSIGDDEEKPFAALRMLEDDL